MRDAIEIKKNEVTNYFNSVYKEKSLYRRNSRLKVIPYEKKSYTEIKTLNYDSEYIQTIEKKEVELCQDYRNFDDMKLKYDIQIKAKENQFEHISQELRMLEDNLRVLQNKQVAYYKDILRQGIDVRMEGLYWVVKNLIELNVVLNNSIFPKFLDYGQIEYLKAVSKKGVEIMQLEIVKRCLKESQYKGRAYNEFGYIYTPSRKFKTPRNEHKRDSSIDVFQLINYEDLQDENNVKIC
jgi:hypothetical protein